MLASPPNYRKWLKQLLSPHHNTTQRNDQVDSKNKGMGQSYMIYQQCVHIY